MNALFIGGTGNISTACSRLAVERGIELVHLNRGTTDVEIPGVETIRADVRDEQATAAAIGNREFDCVVDWIAFTPDQIEEDIRLFAGRTKQFIFISSASVYQKPPSHYLITESTPAYNPFWSYSQRKIECERRLFREYETAGFPVTIVRPSHTYSVGWIPTSFGSRDFTVPRRLLDGRPIVVHGDGESLWTITHVDDFAKGFVGLMGHPQTAGETFHITSDEALSWNQIHRTIAHVLGVEAKIVHIPSDRIAEAAPDVGPGLLGDKAFSVVFDNSKIRRFVPGYQATVPFHEGIERSVAWFRKDESRQDISKETDQLIDRLIADYGG